MTPDESAKALAEAIAGRQTNRQPFTNASMPAEVSPPWRMEKAEPRSALEELPLRDLGLTHPTTGRQLKQIESNPTIVVLYTAGDFASAVAASRAGATRVLLTGTYIICRLPR